MVAASGFAGTGLIPTEKAGRYFPDFIVVDKHGVRWVMEGQSDKEANDPNVLH
jgi:hypothetical protein